MKLTAFLAAALLATSASAQTAPAPTFTFALHGFVSVSGAYQDGAFGVSEGQHSLFSATGAGSIPDKTSLNFDVRQSRFNFSVKGPQVLMGATPTAVMEIDFFQGQGGGANGNVSLLPRLRVAYSELNWGAGKLQLGQQNDLIFAMAPTSLSHIAQPLGYFTGNIGWRRPGFFGFYTAKLPSDLSLELAGEVGRSQWNDASSNTCTVTGTGLPADTKCTNGVSIGGAAPGTPGGIGLGEASGAPALEARATLAYSKYLTLWAATHWQQIDLSGYGAAAPAGAKATTKTTAYNGGLKLTVPVQGDVGLTVAATGFSGNNLAPLVSLGQFNGNGEDVGMWGYWAQLGVNLTKEFSLWGLYGQQQVDKKDFVKGGYSLGAYENASTNVMAMYRDGGYGLSAEWIHFDTKYATAKNTTTITADRTAKSDQYMLTANYFF